MRGPLLLFANALLHFLLLSSHVVAGDELPAAEGRDRKVLYALKHAFNHPLLNENWNGQVCFLNGTNTSWFGISCSNGRVAGITLESLGLSGKTDSHVLFHLTQLTHLSLKNNSIHGSIMAFSFNRKLRSIDLSYNMFDGPISPSVLVLGKLEALHLQENQLTGAVPAFDQMSLKYFNVSYNNLSGIIPKTPILQSFNLFSFVGNKYLRGPPLVVSHAEEQTDQPNREKKFNLSRSTLLAIFAVFNVVAMVAIAVFCVRSKKRRAAGRKELRDSEAEKNKNEEVMGESGTVTSQEQGNLTFFNQRHEFKLDELLNASAEGLGKGNFGSCYKALLDDGSAVVVKRLKDVSPLTSEEFAMHMIVLANLKHPNLLPFLAYYYDKEEKLLVHQLAPNGNLFYRLHAERGTSNRIPFKWPSRLAVAKGVAQAMVYLHINTKPNTSVPHGNLKASNVLLDQHDMAMVSDHSFSSLFSASIASQRLVAYKSPEYLHWRKVSPKSDVWCYGSLVLEILTGKVSALSAPTGIAGVDLCCWVFRAVREEWTAEIFDGEIAEQKRASGGMLKLLKVALRCCEKVPEKRPDMAELLREVEEIRAEEVEEDSDDSLDRSFILEDDRGSITAPKMVGAER